MDLEPTGLAARLRARTAQVHVQAERGGIINALLRGTASRQAYALYLRNLLPVYQALEAGLARHADHHTIRPFAQPALFRAEALVSDLAALSGPQWNTALEVLPEAQRYANRVAEAGQGNGQILIGHAYVRYLGDLSGAQILKGLLIRSIGLGPESVAFFAFHEIADFAAFKAEFRDALDRVAGFLDNAEAVLDAAVEAFSLNIAVSEAVALHQRAAG